MTLSIATWNINGIKARLETLKTWLKEAGPDIACLQEIKSIDENFPSEYFEDLGYNIITHGQKGFNGVAIFSKLPIDEVNKGLPGDENDEQARFLEVVVSADGRAYRVVSLYLPNGNPVDSDKYPYKLAWMERLTEWAHKRLAFEEPLILAGDYNVIPTADDVHDPKAWEGDALYRAETHQAFRKLLHLGFTDAHTACQWQKHIYTFWDYQAGAWPKNHGIRIDHCLLSPQAADCLTSYRIDKHVRGWEKPSDHVPVIIELQDKNS